MRAVRARYEDGCLKPAKPLRLRAGEDVGIIVLRRADPTRWNLDRLASRREEDQSLAEAGLEEWGTALDSEDQR